MTDQEILSRVDHTLLKAAASWGEIKALCDEAVRFKTASVCIPQSYVKPVHSEYGNDLLVCTVVGFPLGYNVAVAKVLETAYAVQNGASEIDMVINIADVKNGHYDCVQEEIEMMKKACGGKILKVIIETCYLSEEEKIRLCGMVGEAGADFIKTSTGFGTAGAALDDIKLFKAYIGKGVKIKAAGGIRTREDMEAFIAAGASRLGTSQAVKILGGESSAGY